MRQVGILPSGCQIYRRVSVLHYDTEKIVYASSLAVYVLDAHTYSIRHILSLNQRAITSIVVSPLDPDLLIVTGRDGTVTLWNIPNEEILSQLLINGSVIAAWNPLMKNNAAILSEDSVRLHNWDTDRGSAAVQETFNVRSDALKPCVFRWNPKVVGWIAIGCNAGAVFLFRVRDKSNKVLQADAKANVVDLQWDKLSTSYLLVAYHNFISLWDAESGSQVHTFDKQPVNITGIAWMDWTAGNFVSINAKNSYLKVWNASQRTPLESIKLKGEAGVLSLTFCNGRRSALYSCSDGAIGVFDMQSMKQEYLSAAGHTETIFGCKFSPSSPNTFCTASYDATVKVWSSPGLELQKTLYGADDIVYCVDWSPTSRMIVAASANGLTLVWDVDTGRELARYLNHTKPSYCVAWNQLDERYIASTSADSSLLVQTVDPASFYDQTKVSVPTSNRKKGPDGVKSQVALSIVKFRFTHPAAVYGCAWSPFKVNVLCTACQDGIVRVFNIDSRNQFVAQLNGHSARAFSCAWSPLLPGYLATGSDDQTIGIWDVDLEACADLLSPTTRSIVVQRKLIGHRGFVRALCWNYEHSQLLLSGSWDFSIRLWNIATGDCLLDINDHIADVYAITSHPLRPFSYLSASRDTTVRLWELEGLFLLMRYRAIWDGNCARLLSSESSPSLLPSTGKQGLSSLAFRIAGSESRLLSDDLLGETCKKSSRRIATSAGGQGIAMGRDEKEDSKGGDGKERRGSTLRNLLPASNQADNPVESAQAFYSLFSFFCGGNGSMELWENALFAVAGNDREATLDIAARVRNNTLRQVFHESEILGKEKSAARKLESSKMSAKKGDLSLRGEDQLAQAAQLYAKLGDFARYCSIMIDLGKWEEALAMAPSVSLEYWKYLSFLYAQHLASQSNERCVSYYLAVGKDAHAIDYYLQYRDPESAMVVAKMSQERTDIIPDYTIAMPAPKDIDKPKVTPEDPQRSRPPMLQMLSAGHIDLQWSEPSSSSKERRVRDRTERELDQSRSIMTEVAACAAKQQLALAQPILAAAHYLAVNEADSAVDVLLDCAEFDLAYAIALCFKQDTAPILSVWADRCASLKDFELALDILSAHPFSEIESGLLLSRYCSESDARALSCERGLHPPEWWADHAKEEEAIGSDADAVTAYVIAQQGAKAIQVGLAVLRRFVRDPWSLTSSTYKILHALKFVDVRSLDESVRSNFFCYMLWFCAHEAASKGLMACAANMLSVLGPLCSSANFPINGTDVSYQTLIFRILAGQREATTLLDNAISQDGQSSSGALRDSLKALKLIMIDRSAWEMWQRLVQPQTSTLKDATADNLAFNIIREIQKLGEALALPSVCALNDKKGKLSDTSYLLSLLQSCRTIVLGSLLPVANQQLKHYSSILTGSRIQGGALRLGDDVSYISINEAVQWRRIFPYSPLLSGDVLR